MKFYSLRRGDRFKIVESPSFPPGDAIQPIPVGETGVFLGMDGMCAMIRLENPQLDRQYCQAYCPGALFFAVYAASGEIEKLEANDGVN